MKWFLLILGAVLFAAGLFRFFRCKENRAARKASGACAYFGLGLGTLAGILLLEPVMSQLPGAVIWGASFAVFTVVGRLLLWPGFRQKP